LQPAAHADAPELVPLGRASNLSRAVQGSLFQERPESNVIPIARPGAQSRPHPKPGTGAKSSSKPPARKGARVPEGQGSLEFLQPLPVKPRTLSTSVEAVIYCEAPVAAILHRAVAAALDWSMVLIGYWLFLMAFYLGGGDFVLNKTNLMVFGGMFLLIAFTYGVLWTLAGAETAGMRWTRLRLTTFEGFPPDGKQRWLRFAAACLSRSTLIGLLWALADEESLTWHDHISRTFPTPRALETQVFHRR
jgi:uncharacterized RDD family membrane protein YckC